MAYITVAEVRAAGLNSLPDQRIQDAIDLWQEVIERYCRQWFEPRSGDFFIDGNNSNTLFLPFPVISLQALYVNGQNLAYDVNHYQVYSSRGLVNDDRRNPRIVLSSGSRNIFAGSEGGRFLAGSQNQRVVGTFGFVEPNGEAPLGVKRALTKLVITKVTQPLYVDPNQPGEDATIALPPTYSSGIITDEWTDWHRIKRESIHQTLPKRADGMTDVIEDPEVRGLLKLYRSPIALAASSTSWRR